MREARDGGRRRARTARARARGGARPPSARSRRRPRRSPRVVQRAGARSSQSSLRLRAVRQETRALARVARRDRRRLLERRVAELREPEAVLLDEVEREPVAARAGSARARATRCAQRLARRDRPLERACASPSQTIALPRSSSQWYARKRPSSWPRVRHGAVPAFSSLDRRELCSAPASTGARSSASAPQRPSGPVTPGTGLV